MRHDCKMDVSASFQHCLSCLGCNSHPPPKSKRQTSLCTFMASEIQPVCTNSSRSVGSTRAATVDVDDDVAKEASSAWTSAKLIESGV